ncbi:TIGR01777 family protein [bacterium]|nr:TIGR01777 family protein [bacterium]
MKSLLITGGSGLVGERITQLALAQGRTVHHLSTRPKTRTDGVRVFEWSEHRFEPEAFAGMDAVIHLAGASISDPWTLDHKRAILDSRVHSSQWLYAALKAHPHGVSQVVSASAIGYYPSHLEKIYTESEAPGSDFLGSVCRRWEEETQRLAEHTGRECRLRIGLVLSEQGGLLDPLLPLARWGLLSPFGSGKQWMSWIHLDDVARMFLYAVDSDWEGAFNAAGPRPVRNREFVQTLNRVLRRPTVLPPAPAFALKLVLGERSALPLMSQNVDVARAQNAGFRFDFPELSGALTDLLRAR